jgi:phage terminase small subunit
MFAREYVIDLNATRAATAAGYSQRTANEQGARLLAKASTKKLVDSLLSKRASRLEISSERILEELAKLAFFDARSIWNEDGSLKPVTEWDDAAAAALAGIEHEKLFEHFGAGNAKHVGTTVKVKMLPRTDALRMLGQYRKLFTEKVEHTADSELIEALAAGRKRLSGDSNLKQPTT